MTPKTVGLLSRTYHQIAVHFTVFRRGFGHFQISTICTHACESQTTWSDDGLKTKTVARRHCGRITVSHRCSSRSSPHCQWLAGGTNQHQQYYCLTFSNVYEKEKKKCTSVFVYVCRTSSHRMYRRDAHNPIPALEVVHENTFRFTN